MARRLRAAVRPAADQHLVPDHRHADPASWRPPPGPIHDRPWAVHRHAVRQSGQPWPPHRPVEHPSRACRLPVVGQSAPDALSDLGGGGPVVPVQPQPAQLAARPGYPWAARWRDAAGQRGRRRLPDPAVAVRGVRAARRPGGVAVRPHEPFRQPLAVRRARQASSTC